MDGANIQRPESEQTRIQPVRRIIERAFGGNLDHLEVFAQVGESCFLEAPLLSPLWRGPALDPAEEVKFRRGWTPLTSLEQAAARTRIFEYSAATPRDFARDFNFLRSGAKLDQLSIHDPYALKAQRNLHATQRFLGEVRARLGVWPTRIDVRVRADALGERTAFEQWLASQNLTPYPGDWFHRQAWRQDSNSDGVTR